MKKLAFIFLICTSIMPTYATHITTEQELNRLLEEQEAQAKVTTTPSQKTTEQQLPHSNSTPSGTWYVAISAGYLGLVTIGVLYDLWHNFWEQ